MPLIDFLLTSNTLIGAIIALLLTAFVQFFFQKRLKGFERQVGHDLATYQGQIASQLKQLEIDLKAQSDRVNLQFQTQFSATHRVREEIAANLLSEYFLVESLLEEFFLEANQTTASSFTKRFEEPEAKIRYHLARSEIYFPDEIFREFATIQLLSMLARHRIWELNSPICPTDTSELHTEIKKLMNEDIPKRRRKLGSLLKAVLLPAEETKMDATRLKDLTDTKPS